jgi:hypothetical protein
MGLHDSDIDMHYRLVTSLSILCLALLTAACGGGEGGAFVLPGQESIVQFYATVRELFRKEEAGYRIDSHGTHTLDMPWLQSCYVVPVWDRFDEISRVDSIKPGITTREEVLRRFGKPDAQDPSGKFIQCTGWTDTTVLFIPLTTDTGILSGGEAAILYDVTRGKTIKSPVHPLHPGGQRWLVGIRFDEHDVVSRVSTSEDAVRPKSTTLGIAKEARTYCPNADLGHADAQLHIGDIHYHGAYGQEADPVRAWVWYSLAAQGGDAQAAERLARVTAGFTPEQLAEAQRQSTAWQPGQCAQELVPAGASP